MPEDEESSGNLGGVMVGVVDVDLALALLLLALALYFLSKRE